MLLFPTEADNCKLGNYESLCTASFRYQSSIVQADLGVNVGTLLGLRGHYMTSYDAYIKQPASHRVTALDMKKQCSI